MGVQLVWEEGGNTAFVSGLTAALLYVEYGIALHLLQEYSRQCTYSGWIQTDTFGIWDILVVVRILFHGPLLNTCRGDTDLMFSCKLLTLQTSVLPRVSVPVTYLPTEYRLPESRANNNGD